MRPVICRTSGVVVLALSISLGACRITPSPSTRSPVRTVRSFLWLVKTGQCEAARSFLSTAAKASFAVPSEYSGTDSLALHDPLCREVVHHRLATYVSRTAHEVVRAGDSALVGLTARAPIRMSAAALLPGSRREEPVAFRLVREGQRWLITVPLSNLVEPSIVAQRLRNTGS